MHVGFSTSVIQRGKTGVAQYTFGLLRGMLPQLGSRRLTLFVLAEDLGLFDFAKDSVSIVPVAERFRPPVSNILWHQIYLSRLVRRHKIDVLHIPSYRRLLWSRPCALVGTIHDLAPFHVAAKYDWKRMFYGQVVARILAKRQDQIVAISRNTARDIERFFGVERNRLSVIHNGIDHTRFSPGSREEARLRVAGRYGLNHPFFLYLARLEHPAKNHVRLISAFEEFKGATHSTWQLVFGGSDWHGADVIHAAIRQSPVGQDILCLGFVPETDLPDLYRAADIFVYPSLYEGFGLPPVEAMACGCPVITSRRGSLGEVVGDAAAIIDPEDFHTIARQLYILATDNAVRNSLRAAGMAQAQKFDWTRTARETLAVYERVVGP